VELTVKLQPAAILPPDTAQLSGEEENKPLGLEVNETDVSPELPEFQPDPVTVTTVPVAPELGESETITVVTMKVV
jgi:hypothetical protein